MDVRAHVGVCVWQSGQRKSWIIAVTAHSDTYEYRFGGVKFLLLKRELSHKYLDGWPNWQTGFLTRGHVRSLAWSYGHSISCSSKNCPRAKIHEGKDQYAICTTGGALKLIFV